MNLLETLHGEYEIRELAWSEFEPLWTPLVKSVFEREFHMFAWRAHMSDEQKGRTKKLGERLKGRYELNLGLFYRGQMVGWSCGYQETDEVFYMMNSAVLPEHQRKGLYRALARQVIDKVVVEGFQKIYSRHVLTNNPILIAKLKMGFKLTTFETNDRFGVVAHLTYHPMKLREKVLDFRVGMIQPDEELLEVLKLR